MTHQCEECCPDSYWQRQISQSYCETGSNCGKNKFCQTSFDFFYKKENIVLEVTNQVQEDLSYTEVLNNSTDEDVTMAVNNEAAENDLKLGPDLETQADGNEEHRDQAREIVESESQLPCNEQKPQCQICEENDAVVAFKPCGHTVVCIGDFSLLLLLLLSFTKCRKWLFLACFLFRIKITFSVDLLTLQNARLD